jgi:hypothetical protein
LRLAAAGRLDALMTYDTRLAAGARLHGITVLSPASRPRSDSAGV